jgi:hypothetical protein
VIHTVLGKLQVLLGKCEGSLHPSTAPPRASVDVRKCRNERHTSLTGEKCLEYVIPVQELVS